VVFLLKEIYVSKSQNRRRSFLRASRFTKRTQSQFRTLRGPSRPATFRYQTNPLPASNAPAKPQPAHAKTSLPRREPEYQTNPFALPTAQAKPQITGAEMSFQRRRTKYQTNPFPPPNTPVARPIPPPPRQGPRYETNPIPFPDAPPSPPLSPEMRNEPNPTSEHSAVPAPALQPKSSLQP
jgi:hypothetical protein